MIYACHDMVYNVHIGSLFTGAIAYANDICILSCSCYEVEAVQHKYLTNIPVWFGLLGDI